MKKTRSLRDLKRDIRRRSKYHEVPELPGRWRELAATYAEAYQTALAEVTVLLAAFPPIAGNKRRLVLNSAYYQTLFPEGSKVLVVDDTERIQVGILYRKGAPSAQVLYQFDPVTGERT